MPVLTIFAGPNGSGKSSVTKRFEFKGRHNLLDADAIAKRTNPSNPGLSALTAGREVIRRTREYLEMGEDFAIETTLAGGWTITAIKAALQKGCLVRVIYVCVDTPELNVQRVRERVAHGGHDVPEDDIRRRYTRSLVNIRPVLKIADQGFVYDNSGAEARIVLETKAGAIVWQAADQPPWVTVLIQDLTGTI